MDWSAINEIAQIRGMVARPIRGWVFHTGVKHGSRLIRLEEKVKDKGED